MSASLAPENEPQIQPRNPFARPGPIPDWRLDGLYLESPPSLVARAETSTSSTSAAATSCGKNDNSGACEKYYGASGSDTTLPIVLGVVIPLVIALVVLLFLHRRHVKKLRREDAEDRHKSLDFGLDTSKHGRAGRTGKNAPEMSLADEKEFGGRRPRGLSLDMGGHNPYLLPPGLQNSRESLHSLSRLNTKDDRYRPTDFIPDDGSIRAPSSMRSPHDDSSSFTGSSSRRYPLDLKQNLVPGGALSGRNTPADPAFSNRKPPPSTQNNNLLAPTAPDGARDSVLSTTSSIGPLNALRASNNYLGQFISGGTALSKQEPAKKEPAASVKEVKVDTPVVHIQAPPPVATRESPHLPAASLESFSQSQVPAATSNAVNMPESRSPRLPQLSFIDSEGQRQQPAQPEERLSVAPTTSNNTPQHSNYPSTDFSQHGRDHQSQPSQSENQIQQHEEEDYYDEYEVYGDHDQGQHYYEDQDYQDYYDYQEQLGFDPRRSMMGRRPLPPDDPSEKPEDRANRIRSFYKEYFDDSKNANHGQYAQYYDGAEGYYDYHGQGGYPEEYYDQATYYPPRGMSQNSAYGRHRATISNGSYQSGPRAYSTASGRYGGHPRMPPKKNLPPPKALNLLPTPHKLKEDTFIPIDFAPPKKFSNQRSGTPDSLRGGLRPYSPRVKPHIPLASSFDDLAVIPSPHQLRKSATFTSLDFAPPGRLRANDTASETGSIRSNRSAMSAVHLHNIRTGAYRVSRIPKEVAGTKDELSAALRPQWDLNR
ncbi:hypothetical protein H2200_013448 [Cladophialophora chaetospira]|uniref:Uncharacterized protein n=1 Tax=Cladophialophora chaetospira TaxID=386627 RepID=A0AA38TXI6_9EURO|nr:hypothetical protein H2200_013448 [Cladophialophora chaetospira]